MAATASKEVVPVSGIAEFATSQLSSTGTSYRLKLPWMVALMLIQQLLSHGYNTKLAFLWSQRT